MPFAIARPPEPRPQKQLLSIVAPTIRASSRGNRVSAIPLFPPAEQARSAIECSEIFDIRRKFVGRLKRSSPSQSSLASFPVKLVR
jgi:hypothetical protein